MTAARNIALSNLFTLLDQVEHKDQVLVRVVRNQPKKEKGFGPILTRVQGEIKQVNEMVKAEVKPGPVTAEFAKPGTLDAFGFIQAMRNAGKRPNAAGIMVRDQSKVREDETQAIAAYIGYDIGGNFGSQEQAARAKANRELSKHPIQGPTREEQRAASKSWTGYVHGMPVPDQKLLANLLAREQAVAEAMLDAKTEEEKAAHQRVLDTIRAGILAL